VRSGGSDTDSIQTREAAAAPSSRDKWLAPSRVVAFAVFLAIPVKLLARRLDDPDLWWHLKTGALIVRNHAIPAVDPFSYTAAGKRWVVQEWGSEVILHAILKWFGLYGILFFRAVMVLILYLLVARLLVRRMGSGMGTWALLALTAFAGSPNWTERPNLFSFVLFAITFTLLDTRDRRIWWFVPIAALWSNLHGMVVLGLGLVFLVAVVESLKVAARWQGADPAWARRLSAVALTSVAASLLNPYGPGMFVHAFRLIKTVQNFVSEWGSPNFHSPGAIIFLALLLLTTAVLAFAKERPDPTDVALVLAFAALTMSAARNLAVSAIVIGAVCSRYVLGAVSTIPRSLPTKRGDQEPSLPLSAMGYLMVLVGLGVVLVAGFPKSSNPSDIIAQSYPLAAIHNLDKPGVRLFVQDGWSGLAIYEDCGPVVNVDAGCEHARVFVDLRWDFYGPTISNDYSDTVDGRPGWNENLDKHCTTHVLVSARSGLAQLLALDHDWQRIQETKRAVTYKRVAPAEGCSQYPIPD
jgi:hypothetical protein